MIYEDYDRQLVRYFVDHVNQHLYPKLKNQTCLQRWWNGLPGANPRLITDERRLDVCMMKKEERTVHKYGCILFENLVYSAGFIRDEQGYQKYDKNIDFLAKYDDKVTIRYDPSNIIKLLVYTLERDDRPSKFLGIIRSRDRLEDRLSLREWKEREKQTRAEGKAIDQTSILAQQRDLYNYGNEKVREMNQKKRGKAKTRQNRKDEHQRIVKQDPDRYELSKALLAPAETSEDETADRSTLSEVEAKDAMSPKDSQTAALSIKSKIIAEDRAETSDRLNNPQAAAERIIQPALLVVSNSDCVNDDDW